MSEGLTELVVSEAEDGQNLISEWKGWTKVLLMMACGLESQGIEEVKETELSGEQQ